MRIKHLKEEENIRLQQAELMALFASLSPDLILRFEKNGNIALANNAAHRTFTEENLVGGHVENVLPILKQFNLEELIDKGKKKDFTVIIGDKSYQFILAGVPQIKVGQLYGRDITELVQKESELKIALGKAEESEKLKADFLARISHEIRSPLVAIQGYSEYLLDEYANMDSDFLDIFRSMDKNSKRLFRTMDLIINTSQLTTSKYEPTLSKVNIEEMLSVIHSEYKTFAEEKNIIFNLNIATPINSVVSVDEYSVHQIFVNLVDNALKFTEKGNVDINVFRENNFKCVEIKDSGIGISSHYIDNLFSTFSQEKTGYTRPYEGTGLGLSLVKNYVDINKATISVKSLPDAGSSFTVKFQEINDD